MSNLVASAVRQGLYTHVVGKRILYYNELESTMDKAARLAEDGADEGTVVIAERQSAGRGRQGRSWVSQPGNLLLSIVFRPNMEQLTVYKSDWWSCGSESGSQSHWSCAKNKVAK